MAVQSVKSLDDYIHWMTYGMLSRLIEADEQLLLWADISPSRRHPGYFAFVQGQRQMEAWMEIEDDGFVYASVDEMVDFGAVTFGIGGLFTDPLSGE